MLACAVPEWMRVRDSSGPAKRPTTAPPAWAIVGSSINNICAPRSRSVSLGEHSSCERHGALACGIELMSEDMMKTGSRRGNALAFGDGIADGYDLDDRPEDAEVGRCRLNQGAAIRASVDPPKHIADDRPARLLRVLDLH